MRIILTIKIIHRQTWNVSVKTATTSSALHVCTRTYICSTFSQLAYWQVDELCWRSCLWLLGIYVYLICRSAIKSITHKIICVGITLAFLPQELTQQIYTQLYKLWLTFCFHTSLSTQRPRIRSVPLPFPTFWGDSTKTPLASPGILAIDYKTPSLMWTTPKQKNNPLPHPQNWVSYDSNTNYKNKIPPSPCVITNHRLFWHRSNTWCLLTLFM